MDGRFRRPRQTCVNSQTMGTNGGAKGGVRFAGGVEDRSPSFPRLGQLVRPSSLSLCDGADGTNRIGLTDTPPDQHNTLVSQELGDMNHPSRAAFTAVGVCRIPFLQSPLTPEAM